MDMITGTSITIKLAAKLFLSSSCSVNGEVQTYTFIPLFNLKLGVLSLCLELVNSVLTTLKMHPCVDRTDLCQSH